MTEKDEDEVKVSFRIGREKEIRRRMRAEEEKRGIGNKRSTQ